MWAARERAAERWGHTATVVQWLVAAFSGTMVKAEEIIPAGVLESAARAAKRPPVDEATRAANAGEFLDLAFAAVYGRA